MMIRRRDKYVPQAHPGHSNKMAAQGIDLK